MNFSPCYRLLVVLPIVCAITCLHACSDDDPVPVSPVVDEYIGEHRVITLTEGLEDFHHASFNCALKAPDGTIITRSGKHKRIDGCTQLTLDTGLRSGTYRLLYLLAPDLENSSKSDTAWIEYGLGCRLKIDENGVEILDSYDSTFNLYGNGTPDSPYSISCSDNFKQLRNVTNDGRTNTKLTPNTYFSLDADIDMYTQSRKSDGASGWLPIGNMPNNPFRGTFMGNGHSISNLWIDRPNSAGVGLFGYVESAIFDDVHIVAPDVCGSFAVGSLAGSTVTTGDSRCPSLFIRCSTTLGSVECGDGSVAVGGLIGEIDKASIATLDNCSNKHTTVTGSYGVGGLVGNAALFSTTTLQGCQNEAKITSHYSGAGGLIGVSDTLVVMSSNNVGNVSGAIKFNGNDGNNAGFGAGGLAGGTGVSYIYTSNNSADIDGYTGVGGLVGSTRVSTEDGIFNNCLVKSSYNTGTISGETSVGGICGEAQFGSCSVYNTGKVTATGQQAHIGGIVGNTSISVIHNTINNGEVSSSTAHTAGGLVGKTTWGAIYASQNFGKLNVTSDYAGGIVALAGNYTVIDYCQNAGIIYNYGTGPTGGIVGEIGDPREWDTLDIANCVIGAVEVILGAIGPVMAVTGDAVDAAVEAAEEVSKIWKAAKKLHTVLHIVEVGLDISTVVYDAVVRGYTFNDFYFPEDLDVLSAEINDNMHNNVAAVDSKMKEIRNSYVFSTSDFSGSLSTEALNPFMGYVTDVATFGQQSDDNSATVNINLNLEREERGKDVEDSKRSKEIVHRFISGVCLVTSAVTLVVSIGASFFTGGATIGLVAMSIGSISTVVGGANAIVESATDYQSNIVVISQCANLGEIYADGAEEVGGIAGHFQQYCYMSDCLNAGRYMGSSDNNSGVIDRADCHSEIRNCLNVGWNWGAGICRDTSADCVIEDNYMFDEASNFHGAPTTGVYVLSRKDICNKSSFKNWEFSGDLPLWYLDEKDSFFPIPYKSQMHKPVTIDE